MRFGVLFLRCRSLPFFFPPICHSFAQIKCTTVFCVPFTYNRKLFSALHLEVTPNPLVHSKARTARSQLFAVAVLPAVKPHLWFRRHVHTRPSSSTHAPTVHSPRAHLPWRSTVTCYRYCTNPFAMSNRPTRSRRCSVTPPTPPSWPGSAHYLSPESTCHPIPNQPVSQCLSLAIPSPLLPSLLPLGTPPVTPMHI